MIKLTDLLGAPFWVRTTAITVVGAEDVHNYPGSRAVVMVGTQRFGVKETVEQVMGMLGLQVG